MKGIRLQLHSGATNVGALNDIQVMFWGTPQPKDGLRPVGKAIVSTDAEGYLNLDISKVAQLAIGEFGFLQVYKLDATDYKDSPVFAGRVEVEDIVSGDEMDYYDSTWERPNDWLPMPKYDPDTQIIAILFGIDTHNHIAFSVAGNYHVDWGDGTTATYNSGVTATKTYNYDDISETTLSIHGYKQALIKITPQSGSNLTSFSCNVLHPSLSTNQRRATLVLDIVAYGSGITSLVSVEFNNLKRVEIVVNSSAHWHCRGQSLVEYSRFGPSLGIFNWYFPDAPSLEYLKGIWHIANSDQNNTFSTCRSLREIPALDCSTVTTATNFIPGGAWPNISNIRRSKVVNMRISHSYINCQIAADAANEIYTNLADLNALELPGETITMTGNPLTGHTPSIATNKGWTVTV
jgi:hypothetical protein